MVPLKPKPFRITVLQNSKIIGFVREITEDGMTVSTEGSFDKGERVELALSFPGALHAVPYMCMVIDSVPGETIETGFVDPDPAAMESLKTILRRVAEAREIAEKSDIKKVLLVECTQLIRDGYKGRLTKEGYDVAAVESAAEAMKYLRDSMPDLVLLDLVLPMVDGFELLKMIREDQRLAGLPVIILSANGEPGEIEKAKTLGISGHLVKSTTSPVKLLQEVNGFFENT